MRKRSSSNSSGPTPHEFFLHAGCPVLFKGLARTLGVALETSPIITGSVAFVVKQVAPPSKRSSVSFQAASILARSNSKPARP